jgi:hypothetical protein
VSLEDEGSKVVGRDGEQSLSKGNKANL